MKKIIIAVSAVLMLTLTACYPFIREIPGQTTIASADTTLPTE